MKIYFDVCSYNRPFDDLKQEKVKLEAEAVFLISNNVSKGKYESFTSYAIELELSNMKDANKKNLVTAFYNSMKNKMLEYNTNMSIRVNELSKFNIKYMDALHIAFCEFYNIDYMLTTDKILLNAVKRSDVKIKVINPIDFVMEVI